MTLAIQRLPNALILLGLLLILLAAALMTATQVSGSLIDDVRNGSNEVKRSQLIQHVPPYQRSPCGGGPDKPFDTPPKGGADDVCRPAHSR